MYQVFLIHKEESLFGNSTFILRLQKYYLFPLIALVSMIPFRLAAFWNASGVAHLFGLVLHMAWATGVAYRALLSNMARRPLVLFLLFGFLYRAVVVGWGTPIAFGLSIIFLSCCFIVIRSVDTYFFTFLHDVVHL